MVWYIQKYSSVVHYKYQRVVYKKYHSVIYYKYYWLVTVIWHFSYSKLAPYQSAPVLPKIDYRPFLVFCYKQWAAMTYWKYREISVLITVVNINLWWWTALLMMTVISQHHCIYSRLAITIIAAIAAMQYDYLAPKSITIA